VEVDVGVVVGIEEVLVVGVREMILVVGTTTTAEVVGDVVGVVWTIGVVAGILVVLMTTGVVEAGPVNTPRFCI